MAWFQSSLLLVSQWQRSCDLCYCDVAHIGILPTCLIHYASCYHIWEVKKWMDQPPTTFAFTLFYSLKRLFIYIHCIESMDFLIHSTQKKVYTLSYEDSKEMIPWDSKLIGTKDWPQVRYRLSTLQISKCILSFGFGCMLCLSLHASTKAGPPETPPHPAPIEISFLL